MRQASSRALLSARLSYFSTVKMETEISSETWVIYWNLTSKLNDSPKRRYISVTSQDITPSSPPREVSTQHS
jgi:hypothetical protein